jgi:hypothetical protein
MKKKTLFFLLMLLVSFNAAGISHGQDSRLDKKYGVYLSLLGDPFPSAVGLNFAYNAVDFLRLNAGVGYFSADTASITSVGLGVKALVPHWDFSPFIGLNYSQSFMSSSLGQVFFYNPANGSISNSLSFVYPSFGLDYQTRGGFDIGLNLAYFDVQNTKGVIPGLNIGMFF